MNKILQILSANSKIGDKVVLKLKGQNYPYRCTIESFDDDYLIVSTKYQPIAAIKADDIESVRKVREDIAVHAVNEKSQAKEIVPPPPTTPAAAKKQKELKVPQTQKAPASSNASQKEVAPIVDQVTSKASSTTKKEDALGNVAVIKKPLPAMGHITAMDGASITITPINGNPFIVSKEKIIDKGLMRELNEKAASDERKLNTSVLWSTLDGEIVCVMGQLSPEQINSRVNTFRDVENYRAALSLAILVNDNVNYPAYVRILEQMRKLCGVTDGQKNTVADNSLTPSVRGQNYYNEGKYEDAIKCFLESLEKQPDDVISIKALVYAYTYNEQTDEAIKTVEKYGMKDFRNPFRLNTKNFTWMLNWLRTQGLWADCLHVIDYKLEKQGAQLEAVSKAKLYAEKATFYLKIEGEGDTLKQAEDCLRQALALDPNNREAKTTLQDISGEFHTTSAAVDSLGNSNYTDTLLEKDIHLEAAPSKSLADKLETEYKQLNYQSHEEKAKVLLQRAKVEQMLNPGKGDQRCILLSMYLTSAALSGYRKNLLGKDSLRFLLCESISVRGTELPRRAEMRVLDTMAIFFNTFYPNKEIVFKNTNRMVDILDGRELFKEPTFYDQVASLMQYRYPFVRLTSYFFNSSYQVSAKEFLRSQGFDIADETTQEQFTSAWNAFILRRRASITELAKLFSNATQSKDFDELYARFKEFFGRQTDFTEVLSDTDQKRIGEVDKLLDGSLLTYFHSDQPDTKELRYNDSLGELNRLCNNYANDPTRFSFDQLATLLGYCRDMLKADFERLISEKKPQLSIDIIGDCSLDDDEEVATFQLVIANAPGKMPASNFAVSIATSDEVKAHTKGQNTNYNAINGGTQQIVQQTIQLAPDVAGKGAVGLELTLSYKAVGLDGVQTMLTRLSLQFNKEEVRINNPYAPLAGNPLGTESRNMFCGREQYIKDTAADIMGTNLPKQIIIYGQRRSGKTSVLNFLMDELQKRGAFCVEFSLEALGKDIRVTGRSDIFYAYIMARIAEAVCRLDEGRGVPGFRYCRKEYRDNMGKFNPNKIYAEYCESFEVTQRFIGDIEDLHQAFDASAQWRGRKMVLLMDEFTHVYTLIKAGLLPDTVMKQWKACTQDKNVHFSVVLIGQDTTPQFMAESYATNAFGIIERNRLSYLPEDGARKLIVENMCTADGSSRFLNKAVQRIIDLTACNPYFLMSFCANLVRYMNDKQKSKVTEVDVDNALTYYIDESSQPLTDEMFHSLYSAVDVEESVKQKSKNVLTVIARGMELRDAKALTPGWIAEQLKGTITTHEVKEILSDLDRREVAPYKEGKHRIKVLMLQKWLIEIYGK